MKSNTRNIIILSDYFQGSQFNKEIRKLEFREFIDLKDKCISVLDYFLIGGILRFQYLGFACIINSMKVKAINS